MDKQRFKELTGNYRRLKVAVIGDFCLDRYLEIDPRKAEVSIETGLPVHNVVRVRPQPGGAGTIVNNLVALGIAEIYPVGFCGEDGEGYELQRALGKPRSVCLDYFFATPMRRTFTYCKPLLLQPGVPPKELNRLDSKNWTPTPAALSRKIANAIRPLARRVDAIIVLEQVDRANTGVVTTALLKTLAGITRTNPALPIVADSRRGLRHFPPLIFKMNTTELGKMSRTSGQIQTEQIKANLGSFAKRQGRAVYVTAAEAGMMGATPDGRVEHVPALPLRGPIDIVGAGDSVTANLASALAAGASLRESMELANAAASVVIHKLGTTGTAALPEIKPLI
ncbi:MAG: PfkB family carbohydrate kinase [Verrucomicrobiota bacterium]